MCFHHKMGNLFWWVFFFPSHKSIDLEISCPKAKQNQKITPFPLPKKSPSVLLLPSSVMTVYTSACHYAY